METIMLGICCVYMGQALFNRGQEHSDFATLNLVGGAALPLLALASVSLL